MLAYQGFPGKGAVNQPLVFVSLLPVVCCADELTVVLIRGPVYRIFYDNLMIMPKLRSTYDGHLIYKISCEGRKPFLVYDSLAKL